MNKIKSIIQQFFRKKVHNEKLRGSDEELDRVNEEFKGQMIRLRKKGLSIPIVTL